MTERHEKSFPITDFKSVGEPGSGQFKALVSVFGNVDYGGDRVMPGAFEKSIARFVEQGKKIPILYSHGRGLDDWIGEVDPLDAVETEAGLEVGGQLDMDDHYGRKAHKLMSKRLLTEFSFAYNEVETEPAEPGVKNLNELDLIEVGPTLRGMNPATELLAVKSFAEAEQASIAPLVALLNPDDRAAIERCSQLLSVHLDAGEKAGARLSKETRSAISQAIDLLASLISVPDEETPKSLEAQTEGEPQGQADGAASDPDSDLITRLNLLKET